MRIKKMTPYWIFGGIAAGFQFIASIIFTNFVLVSILESANPEQAVIGMLLSIILFCVIAGALGIVQIVVAILHLVNYWKDNFENNDSKVTHALYQFFFGLGIIGLIIVLVKQ